MTEASKGVIVIISPLVASANGREAAFGRLQLFGVYLVIANVYVDGFNLYYGCLKDTPYRWLDLSKLCEIYLPSHRINRIRYFTAPLIFRNENPGQRQRQQTYLRALQTIPNLSIHYGHFLTSNVSMRLAHPPTGGQQTAIVVKSEEKGTDVNIATHLIFDAFDGDCDMAVVISNDSDLATPIQMVRERFGMTVGVLNPHRKPSKMLLGNASFYRHIRRGPLGASQFPDRMQDANGAFTKPPGW